MWARKWPYSINRANNHKNIANLIGTLKHALCLAMTGEGAKDILRGNSYQDCDRCKDHHCKQVAAWKFQPHLHPPQACAFRDRCNFRCPELQDPVFRGTIPLHPCNRSALHCPLVVSLQVPLTWRNIACQ